MFVIGDKTIKKIRAGIDAVDEKILKLITRRGDLAKKIGKIKKSRKAQVYVPSREKQIFDHLAKINPGPYGDAAIFAIFREIISATRALEVPTRVAFLGPEATFTHMASVRHFGHSATFLPQPDIAEVFAEVEKNHAEFGVVPVENTTEGVVNYTLDKFVESELKIVGEIVIPVAHHLLSAAAELGELETVYSHRQAFSQCRGWLAKHLQGVKLEEMDSTAQAAKFVTTRPRSAAIASEFAADLYGLNILARNIQDEIRNFTRFLVLGQDEAQASGNDKTSVVFVAKDRVGILYRLLKPLSDAKINLSKIESRPLKKRAWEYMFFVDMDGHVSESRIKKAMAGLKTECEFFKILGSYPKSTQRL